MVPVGTTIALIFAAGESRRQRRGRRRRAARRTGAVGAAPPRAGEGLAARPQDRRAARRRPRAGEDGERPDREGRRARLRREPEGAAGNGAAARGAHRRRLAQGAAAGRRARRGPARACAAPARAAPSWPRTFPPARRAGGARARRARPAAGVSNVWRIMAERMTASWTTAPHFYLVREVNVSRLVAWRERAQQADRRAHHLHRPAGAAGRRGARPPPARERLVEGRRDRRARRDQHRPRGRPRRRPRRPRPPPRRHARPRRDRRAPRGPGRRAPRPASCARPTSRAAASRSATSACTAWTPSTPSSIRRRPRSSPSAASPTAWWRVNGQPAVQPTMVLTLSCDHRALDGARGAQFLGALADLIEEPLALLA